MKFLYTVILFTLSFNLFSQRGKDGAVTITAANTIVNQYTSVTADIPFNGVTIPVTSSAGFNPGDLVMIIQMQGARVNAQWDTVYVDPNNSMAVPSSNNLTYGAIMDYHNTGNHEFAQVSAVPNGTSIVLDCGTIYPYTYSYTNNQGGSSPMYGHIQVIKVPRYSSLTINGGGSITCPQWNGATGGIAVVEVENNATLSSTPSFNVSGKGFRGGIKDNASSVFGGNKWGALNQNQGGYKGESIAWDTTTCKPFAALIGRGAIANGGGGGDAHNAGGGGGSNGGTIASYNGYGNPASGYAAIWNLEGGSFATNTSSGGGRGGYTFSNMNRNATTTAPGAISTTTNNWSGDMRRNAGGLGGRPLDYSTGRIYLGGGGGAGDGNENQAGAGGNGGGMVYVVCYGDLTGAGTIVADGANGTNSTPGCSSNDGGGGGGGGGTIILKVNGTVSLSAATALSAVGGNGGNVVFSCIASNYDGYGPGGGGGGGYIASTGALPSNNIAGGNNGIQTGNGSGNANSISMAFPPNGATRGGSGSTGSLMAYTLTTSPNLTVCANQAFTLTASSTEPSTSLYWYNTEVGGGFPVVYGATYAHSGYATAGTYTLFAGVCTGTYRQPVIITVTSGLSMNITGTSTICPGQSTVLTASGATTYTWVSGPTTNTISVSPASSTIYTVNGTSGLCSGTQTVNVTVSPTPTLSVANAAICSGNTATLTVSSSATSFTWMPGGQTTSSITVTPGINTTYTVTGSNGACSGTTTATVNVTATPTLASTSPSTICAGQVATFTVSGAGSYTWSPGNVAGSTFTLSPASSTSVSVIGANGTCTSQTTSSLTVTPNPAISVASQTICPGQSTILTANGATTYTWVSGPTTNTISVSPGATSVYTVNGTTNSCTSSQTATVTIGTVPSLTVSGNTSICSGNSTTLTASGASSYTWATGGQLTSTVSLNPNSTSSYTVTGSNGTCSNTITTTVNVTPTPTLSPSSPTICPGQTATLTVGGAATYTWMPGNVTGTSYTIAPASNTVVTVTGANGSCTTQATSSITISGSISLGVNNPTICPGQITTLTANGATTYTWTGGGNTNTLSVNPSSTAVYTVSGTAGTCTGSTTSTVTVIGQPTISITGNTSICSGNSTTLTANGATSYTWAASGELTSTVSLSPASTTDYTITGSNGVCSNTTIATVSVTPTPSLAASSVTICPSGIATLTVNGAATYTWMPGSVTGTSYTIAPSSNTVVTVTGANGSCTTQATASVTIGTGISIIVNSPTICAGESTTLTAGGATTYTWDSGIQTNTLTVNPASTTIYTISGTAGTCTGSTTSTVTVLNLPVLSVTGNTAICSGNTTTLTAHGATSYTWANGGQLTASVAVNPSADITYTITAFDGACTNTTTASVSVTPTPSLTANPVSICTGQTGTLTVSGATTYTWSPGNIVGDTYTDSPASTSTYTVVGANGVCTSQTITSITVGSGISIAVNNPTICAGQSAVLTATSTATSYTWDSGANSNTLSVNPASTTVYTISGSNGSCVGTNTATVTVNPVPIVNATATDICTGQTATLTVTGTATTYTWSNGNNNSSQTVSPSSTTVYTVSGTNSFGCVSTTAGSATVNVNAVPNVTVNAAAICQGQTVTLTANGATSYTWSTFATTGSINVSPATTTTYAVVGATGGCSSSYTTTVTVSQSPTLSVNAPVTTGCAPLCINFTDATSASCSTITYNFGDGNTGNTNNPNHCFNSGGNYTVTATCTNTLGCSSTYTLPSVIQVLATPVAGFNISEGDVVTVGTTVNFVNTSSNALLYGWDYCNGTSTSTNVSTSYADTGSCCVTLLASNATCTNSATKCLKVVREAVVVIPNVFTPNGDNSNDFFKVSSNGLKNLSCAIFDRWGLKLYEWEGVNGYWDGSVKSGTAPDGTYFYIINYTDQLDKSTTEKGFLSLFRN